MVRLGDPLSIMGMMFIGSFSARILQASLETVNKDLSYLRYASSISLTASVEIKN
jgi:uncharacterized membrane protein